MFLVDLSAIAWTLKFYQQAREDLVTKSRMSEFRDTDHKRKTDTMDCIKIKTPVHQKRSQQSEKANYGMRENTCKSYV